MYLGSAARASGGMATVPDEGVSYIWLHIICRHEVNIFLINVFVT